MKSKFEDKKIQMKKQSEIKSKNTDMDLNKDRSMKINLILIGLIVLIYLATQWIKNLQIKNIQNLSADEIKEMTMKKRIKSQNNVQQQKQTIKNANRNLNYAIKRINNFKKLIKVNIYLITEIIETIKQCQQLETQNQNINKQLKGQIKQLQQKIAYFQ